MEVGEAWRNAQGDSAKYVVYPDGSQGGETDMARRMRIGQLQGALLSVVGLREIEPSISALQNMPCCSAAGTRWTTCAKDAPGDGKEVPRQGLRGAGLGRRRLGALLLEGAALRPTTTAG